MDEPIRPSARRKADIVDCRQTYILFDGATMRKSTYPLPLLLPLVLVAVWMTSAARWTAEGFTTAFTVTVHSGSCCPRCAPKGALFGTTRRESFGEILGSTLLPGVVAASSATVATGCAPQPANDADSYGDEYPFRVSLIVLCCSTRCCYWCCCWCWCRL